MKPPPRSTFPDGYSGAWSAIRQPDGTVIPTTLTPAFGHPLLPQRERVRKDELLPSPVPAGEGLGVRVAVTPPATPFHFLKHGDVERLAKEEPISTPLISTTGGRSGGAASSTKLRPSRPGIVTSVSTTSG